MMKTLLYTVAVLAVTIVSTEGFSQTDTGDGVVYRLSVVEDVWIETANSNKNNFNILILGKHPGFPKKRSLLRFESLPTSCASVRYAKMYLYFDRAFKTTWYSNQQAPYICRTLQVHQLTKYWKEAEATTTRRLNGVNWEESFVGIGTDTTTTILDSVDVCPVYPRGYIEFDISPAAINWKNGQPNYGVLVYDTEEAVDGRDLRFFSSENSATSTHSFLNVMCDGPPVTDPTGPPTGPPGPP